MGRHHVRHASHHRFHKKMAAHKTHQVLEGRSQARDAPRQARLTTRSAGGGLIHIAPPLPADIRSGPTPFIPTGAGPAPRSRPGSCTDGRNADSLSSAEGLEPPRGVGFFERRVAVGDISKARSDPDAADRARGLRGQRRQQAASALWRQRRSTDQPFPNNYRSELLAFMQTYLNNPVGVHDAAMAEPVQRDVDGKMRYVSCLRFAARESDGSYREAQRACDSLRQWPARPNDRESRRGLRRRGLCAVSRAGKNDAITHYRAIK